MEIQSGRVRIVLHERKGGGGTPLLLLHALYGSSADWGGEVEAWPGPVFALDFSGHGASGRIRGGSYHVEHLLSDADLALRRIGTAAVAGAGSGAWYGLLLAGTRVEQVPACLLLPGAGLAAGGVAPDPLDVRPRLPTAEQVAAFEGTCDPNCMGLEHDPRPPDFIEPFARAASRILLLEGDGDATSLPPWWQTLRACGAESAGPHLASALTALARATRPPPEPTSP